MNQHDLMVSVLTAAGGEPIESHAAPGYTDKIADILFPADNVIVEVKSFTTDRAASDETSEAVGEMFSSHTHMGAPVIFGTVTVKLHDLPPAIAMNTLRIAGKRVLAEAKAANAQLKATKAALGRPEAMGLLALITPPFRLDRHSIVALVGDAMRDNRCRSIDQLFLVDPPPPRGAGALSAVGKQLHVFAFAARWRSNPTAASRRSDRTHLGQDHRTAGGPRK